MSTDSVPAQNSDPEHLIIGQIVAPFGVKGELKVNILTEFPDRFQKLGDVLLAPFASIAPGHAPTAALNPKTVRSTPTPGMKPLNEPTQFKIESTHIHKGQLLLKLEGIESPNDAEILRGCWVLVPTAEAKRLPRGAYYIYQIVGLEVYTDAGAFIGKVEDVLTTSANDVYVVKGSGVEDPTGELLVPAIKAIVRRIDKAGGRMVIADPKDWT